MKRSSAAAPGLFSGAHKWFTGILTTAAALLALAVNARNLGIAPWLGLLDLNFADHAASRIVLTPRSDTLRALGDTAVLTATVTDAHGAALAGATLRWRSVDTSIAVVDSGGAVVARAPGRSSIEVTVREVTARATIHVAQQPASITLVGDSAVRLADGDSLRLLAQVQDARGHRVLGLFPRWETADSAVLAVDSLGLARALAPGRAYVRVSAGGQQARLRVDVALAPAALVLQSGEGQRALAGRRLPDPVVLQVRARAGQPVPGTQVLLSADDEAGRVEPDTATTDADGRVRAAWTLSPRAGIQHLVARVPGVDSALTVTAEADPAPGNVRIEVLSPDLRGVAGEELSQPVLVRLTDTLGLALGLVRIGWSSLEGGTIAGSARTDSSGAAQAYWTLGRRAGRQRLLVQVGNPRLIPATPVVAVAEAGAPSGVVLQSGQGQRATAGTRLPKAIVVLVRDAGGNPVGGASVTVLPAAGSVEDSVLITGPDGRAAVRWTLGAAAGEQRLALRLAGTAASVQVTATSRAPVPVAPARVKPRRG